MGGCGVPVQQACERVCLFAASTELDELANQGSVGWVRGSVVLAGVSNGQRAHAGTRGFCD